MIDRVKRILWEAVAPPPLTLSHGNILLRSPVAADFPAWVEAKSRDRHVLEPVQPAWHANHLERSTYERRCRAFDRERLQNKGYAFHIFEASDARFLGFMHLSPIRLGPSQSATIGYWIAQPEWGKGYASLAVEAIVEYGFSVLALERIDAHCLPSNTASIRVLEKAGFKHEGRLASFLEVGGRRQDHLIYGIARSYS